jgi:serine/threonine-protein kinase
MAATTGGPPPERRGSRTGLMFLIGFLVLLVVAGAAYVLPRVFEQPPDDEQVPALVGLTQSQARAAIREAGLAVGTVRRELSDTVPADEVISQDPNRDLYVPPGSAVSFTLSSGKPEVEVPYVLGQPKDSARTVLESNDLKVKFETEESDEPKDNVVRTEPASGQRVAEGTTVTLFVSAGPKEVPAVVGQRQGQAERAIRAAGFEVEVVETAETTEPKKTVIRQIPDGGTADQGDTITIFVSIYEPPVEPPPTETPVPTETPTIPVPTETPTTPTAVPTTTVPPPSARRR